MKPNLLNIGSPLRMALLPILMFLGSCGSEGESNLAPLLLATSGEAQEASNRMDLTLFSGGEPLRNTSVYYYRESDSASLSYLEEVRTNERGEISLFLPEGEYTFEVFSLGDRFQLHITEDPSSSYIPTVSLFHLISIRPGLHGYPAASGGETGTGDTDSEGEEGSEGDNEETGGDGDSGEPEPEYRNLKVQVSGLDGTAVLKNHWNEESIQITSNGIATFPTEMEDGSYYTISIQSSPQHQECSLTRHTGYVGPSMVLVQLECSTPEPVYHISGTVEGLYRDLYLGLTTEGEYIRIWSDDGSKETFRFRSEVRSGDDYNVKIPTIPYNFTCEIENASGTVTDHDITDIRVVCTPPEHPAPEQPVTVSTLNLEGIGYLYGIDYSPNGYLYLSHNGRNVIKVDPDSGQTWVVLEEGPENGNPEFDTITGITVGPDGTIYLNDTELFTTYRISTRYQISVFLPQFVAFTAFDLDVGPDGNVYIADYGNERILRVDQQGNHTVVADLGEQNPMGLAVAQDGTVYFTVGGLSNVYKIKHGIVSRLAGGDACGFKDGVGSKAFFCHPDGLAIDSNGNIVVADRSNNAIRRITPDGVVTTVAGSGAEGQSDGPGAEATFTGPRSLTTLPDGRIAVNARSGAIRIIAPMTE